jgi:hypothetical protein
MQTCMLLTEYINLFIKQLVHAYFSIMVYMLHPIREIAHFTNWAILC